jgi:hypothetical protein
MKKVNIDDIILLIFIGIIFLLGIYVLTLLV